MPSPRPVLGIDEIERFIGRRCFQPGAADRIGLELEWLCCGDADSTPPGLHERAKTTTRRLRLESAVTWEPGGQLELSSPPLSTLEAALSASSADLSDVASAFANESIRLLGVGLDPRRPPHRVVHTPRYAAMEAFFDREGTSGRTMMCSTAAVQINLDLDRARDKRRWYLAHAVGPVLAAAFANSPLMDGRPTGWLSTRLAIWSTIDRSRTSLALERAHEPSLAWALYALNAQVMLIRHDDGAFVPVTTGMTFRDWMTRGDVLGYPTLDDLGYHLTTLFPPVRPRGWLELRMIDALPDPWWQVAVAVATALLYDERAAAVAERVTRTTKNLWAEAARVGLRRRDLAAAAQGCFTAAIDALPRLGAAAATVELTREFTARYVSQARSPADDLLQAWKEHGVLSHEQESQEVAWV